MRKAPLVRENRHKRQPSGRGRSSKRTPTSPSAAAKRGGAVVPVPESAARPARRPRRFDFTARALIAIVVLAVVMISFANSLRVWYIQSGDLATADAAIAARSERVTELQDELARWDDSAYVKAQARARLGWVMPGEVGYRVVDEHGQVLSGSNEIEGVGNPQGNQLEAQWWDRLASSMKNADTPMGVNR